MSDRGRGSRTARGRGRGRGRGGRADFWRGSAHLRTPQQTIGNQATGTLLEAAAAAAASASEAAPTVDTGTPASGAAAAAADAGTPASAAAATAAAAAASASGASTPVSTAAAAAAAATAGPASSGKKYVPPHIAKLLAGGLQKVLGNKETGKLLSSAKESANTSHTPAAAAAAAAAATPYAPAAAAAAAAGTPSDGSIRISGDGRNQSRRGRAGHRRAAQAQNAPQGFSISAELVKSKPLVARWKGTDTPTEIAILRAFSEELIGIKIQMSTTEAAIGHDNTDKDELSGFISFAGEVPFYLSGHLWNEDGNWSKPENNRFIQYIRSTRSFVKVHLRAGDIAADLGDNKKLTAQMGSTANEVIDLMKAESGKEGEEFVWDKANRCLIRASEPAAAPPAAAAAAAAAAAPTTSPSSTKP